MGDSLSDEPRYIPWRGSPEEIEQLFKEVDDDMTTISEAFAAYAEGFDNLVANLVKLSERFQPPKPKLKGDADE